MIETPRLRLRRPRAEDARPIFDTYAADPAVTRYLAWPRHRSLDDTRAFLDFSQAQWRDNGYGPLLIESRADGRVLGSTGLCLEAPGRASTGYVLAQEAWGQGYATEALRWLMESISASELLRVEAACYHAHRASARVLEKCGFDFDRRMARHTVFPALGDSPQDVLLYSRALR